MPFNATSPIRRYQYMKLAMPSPRASSPAETPATPLTESTLLGTAADAPSRVTTWSGHTSNTGGRARQNWRNSVSSAVGSLRRSNTTSNPARLGPISAPIQRLLVGRIDESPVDPALIPSGVPASPVVDDGPITKPDEPRSFLDLDSDESSEYEGPYSQPIISRAESVRVQRPDVVQNNSGSGRSYTGSEMTIQVYNGDLLQASIRSPPIKNILIPMSTPKEYTEDVDVTEIPQTPATQTTVKSTKGMGPPLAYKKLTANTPSPQLNSRFSATTVDSPLSTGLSRAATFDSTTEGPEAALKALTGESVKAPITAVTPVPQSQDLMDISSSGHSPTTGRTILNPLCGENVETIIETLDASTTQTTLPSLFGGFGAVLNNGFDHNIKLDSLCSLGLNPVGAYAARLHRATSAPHLPNQHAHRKVTIRPSDLVIADTHGNHKLFRDEVVSTPYPARNDSIIDPEEGLTEKKLLATTLAEKSDRFPSPNRAEVLVLQLVAARHAGMKKTMAIEIVDRGTFDDEQLFQQIKQSYNSDFLGPARRLFSARQLNHATCLKDTSFNTKDFIKHLKQPVTGHKRKAWLLWLRQHQSIVSSGPQDASHCSPFVIPRMPFQRSLPLPPKVVLSFEFSILAIALAVLLCLSLSCLATTLWVLFGVPGFEIGSSTMGLPKSNWQHDAQGRVLTGLVLGIFIHSLSSLGTALWIGGSYVLL